MVFGDEHERSWLLQLGLFEFTQLCQQCGRLAMNCDEAAADRGRKVATPAFLAHDTKRMLGLFVSVRED